MDLKGERSSEYFCFDVMNWMKRFVQLIVLVDESKSGRIKPPYPMSPS